MHLQARLGRGSRDLKSNWIWHLYPDAYPLVYDNNPFPHASQHNDMNVIKYLVSCDIDIIQDDEFHVSLTIAVECGHYDMAVLLHKIGCDIKFDTPHPREPYVSIETIHKMRSYYEKHGGIILQ